MIDRLRQLACIVCLALLAAAAMAPRGALASDLTILAERMGDTVVELPLRATSRMRTADEQDQTGVWIYFGGSTSGRITQVNDYFIESEPNDDGTVNVIVRTTLTSVDSNFAYWTTTKTIYCDGEEVAYIGPDYEQAGPGESISQEARFSVSGGGAHHITSIEEEFREGTETSAGWDFEVNVPFVITATAATGGSIEPDGPSLAYEGTSKLYRIEADAGYRISNVIMDDLSVGARPDYRFTSIDSNHTIEARFVKTWRVTVVDGINGSIIDRQTVDDGDDAEVPSIPKHEGYRFDRWSSSFDDIDADTTITARYIRVHDVVFYDRDGHELSRQSVDHGSAATDPGIPPLDGYTASGWDTSFISVTKDLSIHPVYEPIISVKVPTLVACTIMPDGSVVEPTGYRIENRSVVPVTASDMATEYLADDVSVEMADDLGCIYRTGKMVGRLDIAEGSSQCFTWHIGDLDPRENADLIGQAVKEPTTVCRVTFTFEEAA